MDTFHISYILLSSKSHQNGDNEQDCACQPGSGSDEWRHVVKHDLAVQNCGVSSGESAGAADQVTLHGAGSRDAVNK
jgi:hypothetical protein